jgi:YD repeat-containing protein
VYEKKKISDTIAQVKEYTYNSIGRLISITQNGEQTEEGMTYSTTKFTYDKTGNLIRILTPKGHEIRREYDSTNRLVAEYHVEKGGEIKNQTSFIYDKAGNLIKVTDNNGQAITYTYDLLNRETKRVLKNGGIQQKVYDKNGRVVRIIRPNEYAKLGEQAQGYQYEYDILGRILSITAPDSTIVTSNAYNEAGEPKSVRDGEENLMEKKSL